MAKVIPHGADTDSSYELEHTDADGNAFYRKIQPVPPVATSPQGPGAAADTTPTTTIKSDADHRVPASPHAGP